tara:strand:+ start:56 stop:229 length:174 start_codon:yes stop_codon:yes gene_type:complete
MKLQQNQIILFLVFVILLLLGIFVIKPMMAGNENDNEESDDSVKFSREAKLSVGINQ